MNIAQAATKNIAIGGRCAAPQAGDQCLTRPPHPRLHTTVSIGAELSRWGLKTEGDRSTEQNSLKLSIGCIIAYAMHEQVGDSYFAPRPMQDVETTAIPLETKVYYLMLSHQVVAKEPERAECLWARLGNLRHDTMPELLRKYIPPQH